MSATVRWWKTVDGSSAGISAHSCGPAASRCQRFTAFERFSSTPGPSRQMRCRGGERHITLQKTRQGRSLGLQVRTKSSGRPPLSRCPCFHRHQGLCFPCAPRAVAEEELGILRLLVSCSQSVGPLGLVDSAASCPSGRPWAMPAHRRADLGTCLVRCGVPPGRAAELERPGLLAGRRRP